MILTAQQILEEKLLNLSQTEGSPAQVGYDLSIKQVCSIKPGGVYIDKTVAPSLKLIEPKLRSASCLKLTDDKKSNRYHYVWYLKKGAYDIMFNEGCDIPADRTGFIVQRSSLLRSGVLIQSSIFDPGFNTTNIGCVMFVLQDTFIIERDARVAQMYFLTNNPVDVLYNGQWQGDKQRKDGPSKG